MKIAVLSGKGGTGKTTVSTSLAFISGIPILDMDIEAPNTQLFLKGKKFKENKVKSCYPEVDMSKCNLCGECGKFCRFNFPYSIFELKYVFPQNIFPISLALQVIAPNLQIISQPPQS